MLDADALLSLRTAGLIEKTRFTVPWRAHVWEVDVFSGANASAAILLSGFAGHFVENGEQM